ncbi:MAG: PilT/PilU family type 4a pilus ATPase [Acidimicrobiia bacterium]|nr:PilT/PilU family type 4a pilus ATPase [Acidimicrobiia bacterium]
MNRYESELAQIVADLNGAAKRSSRSSSAGSSESLDQLLTDGVRLGASDLLVLAGAPLTYRVNGALKVLPGPLLESEATQHLLLPLLSPKQFEELQRAKSIDFSFTRSSVGRFRANIHYQRGAVAGSIRILPTHLPTIESLHLPKTLGLLAQRRQGLVLITGPTGSGKSSTLAALVNLINTTRRDHIITIEDPIEFVHANHSSLVEHIEVGVDTPDFLGSLRGILRQTPDVILVGEMRDPETIATVLTAAETGHLIFSTLHTNDTSQAVLRILDSFPPSSQRQIRQQLSLALLAVVAQQLLLAADGSGRYPVVEILVATAAVRNLIRKGEDHQLYSTISTSLSEGMITMEQSLAEMVRAGRITHDAAFAHCLRPEELKRYLA